MATLEEDVISELHRQTESGKIQWHQAGPNGVIAEMNSCSFLISKASKMGGYMALHLRPGNRLSLQILGASPEVDRLFYRVVNKLGLDNPLTDQEALQVALDSLQRNDSQSKESSVQVSFFGRNWRKLYGS